MQQGLTKQDREDWQESLAEMTSDELMYEWKLARKLCSTPPEGGAIEIQVDGKKESFTTEEYSSGAFFQISQLIRSEMKRRGISIPGVER